LLSLQPFPALVPGLIEVFRTIAGHAIQRLFYRESTHHGVVQIGNAPQGDIRMWQNSQLSHLPLGIFDWTVLVHIWCCVSWWNVIGITLLLSHISWRHLLIR
jgi:hypothetical protein